MNTPPALVARMWPEQQCPGFQQHPAPINGFSKPHILLFFETKENINIPLKEKYPSLGLLSTRKHDGQAQLLQNRSGKSATLPDPSPGSCDFR